MQKLLFMMFLFLGVFLLAGCGRGDLERAPEGARWSTGDNAPVIFEPEAPPAELESIEIKPDEVVIPLEGERNVTLRATYDDGSEEDVTAEAAWTLEDATVAKLEGPRVIALKPGKSFLHAEFGGMRATIDVEVRDKKIDEIRIAPRMTEVRPGGKFLFKAWGIYDSGAEEEITDIVSWTSQDDQIAVISNLAGREGELTGVTRGRVEIMARIGELSTTAQVNVTEVSELVQLAISPPSANLLIDAREHFTVTGVYTDGTGADLTPQVDWTPGPEGFITINQDGSVQGIIPGETTLTATFRGLSATVPITVSNALVTDLHISPPTVTVGKYGQQQFSVVGDLSDGTHRDLTDYVLWQTSDSTTASVNASGMAVGNAPGLAIISAQMHGQRAEARFQVSNAPILSLEIEPFAPILAPLVNQQMRAIAHYGGGIVSEVSRAASWESSDSNVARIEQDGWLLARNAGTTVVLAKLGDLTASTSVSVTDAALARIEVDPPNVELGPGHDAYLRATGSWSNGTRLDITESVVWTSSDPSVGVSNERGKSGHVDAIALGGATVTATLGPITGESIITVTDRRLVEIELEPTSLDLSLEERAEVEATGIFSDGSEREITDQAFWTSSNPLLVGAPNTPGDRGEIHALNPGSVNITVTLDGVSATLPVNVSDSELVAIELDPADATVNNNSTTQFTATGVFADGARADLTSSVAFSTTDLSVARAFNSDGVRGQVLALDIGQTIVRARHAASGLIGETTLQVEGAALNRLVVTPRDSTTPIGQTRQFTAMALFEDGSQRNVTARAEWKSLNPSIISVDSYGLVRTLAKGDAKLTATFGDLTTEVDVEVNGAELVEIQVTPFTPEVARDTIMRFWATAIYSDGTREDVSEGVAWGTGDPLVMSIFIHHRWPGIAIANAAGTTKITAEYKGLVGETTVTVTDARLVEIKVAPIDLTVAPGTELQYVAQAIFDDGTSRDVTFLCNWTTDNPHSADVLHEGWRDQGKVVARREGEAEIRCGYQNTVGVAKLTITGTTISHIQVIPFTPTVNEGDMLRFWATAVFTDGTTQHVTDKALWQTSDPLVATIANSRWQEGLTTAQAPGTTRVLATYEGVTGETELTVTGLQISQIQVTPFIETIPTGYYLRMIATAIYNNGQARDITGQATWTATDPMIADVYASFWVKGWALGISPGTSFIQATHNGVTGQARVTVTDAMLTGIELDPPMSTLLPEESVEFEATGLFSDGSMREVTHYVTWSSSDQSVGDVSNAWISRGEATAFSPGMTDIMATQGSVTGSAPLTVVTAP